MNFSGINRERRQQLKTIADYKRMVDECMETMKIAHQKIESLQSEIKELKEENKMLRGKVPQ